MGFSLWLPRSGARWAGLAVAAGLLLSMRPAPAVEPTPDTADIGCPAVELLFEHRDDIARAAAVHGIPGVAIAGVIAAEWSLNRSFVDTAQERWLSLRLQRHDDAWWEQWAEDSTLEAERVRAANSGRSGNWPLSLLASGYVMSFGPAQIKPITVLPACRHFAAEEPVCRQGVKGLMAALLSDADSLRLAAVVLRQEADVWRTHTGGDATRDLGLLATLYSTGAQARVAMNGEAGRARPNGFGRWVADHRAALEGLLAAQILSTVRCAP
jgi:hypothetical protein